MLLISPLLSEQLWIFPRQRSGCLLQFCRSPSQRHRFAPLGFFPWIVSHKDSAYHGEQWGELREAPGDDTHAQVGTFGNRCPIPLLRQPLCKEHRAALRTPKSL